MPVVTMVAGPNGSGKSTLIAQLVAQGIALGEYLNADDIAARMTGTAEDVARRAQQEVRQRRQGALDEGRDHCFETVMSHPSHIEHMHRARATRFETRLMFVATDSPAISLGRVANRVLHGGHDVPADRVAARYSRCLANLPDAVAACDRALIFDNSTVAQPLRLLADIQRGAISQKAAETTMPAAMPGWWLEILPRLLSPNNSIGSLDL